MRKVTTIIFLLTLIAYTISAKETDWKKGLRKGKAEIGSFSTITFGPEGILFVGDSKSGKVFALDTEDIKETDNQEPFELKDVESKIAAYLGTNNDGVIIHDMAVNPISQNIYLAVSRSNARELGFWKLPNDINYANILLKISLDGDIEEVQLDNINHSSALLPNPKSSGEESWRGSDLRTETITDLEFSQGKVFVAGLSNEEFASTLRIMKFPFSGEVTSSTVEIWHAAHGKFETQSPIRTLLPYQIEDQDQLLAAYTCTPLVSIPINELQNGKHIKSKTLAELGSGNIPLDIITYQKNGKEYILIANNSRSLMRIDPDDLKVEQGLSEKVNNGNTAGVPYVPLSKVGITQIDNLNNSHVLTLQRMPNGQLDLKTYSVKWL